MWAINKHDFSGRKLFTGGKRYKIESVIKDLSGSVVGVWFIANTGAQVLLHLNSDTKRDWKLVCMGVIG